MASKYLSPKVVVEEVDSRLRGIARVAATIPAFVGLAEKGPIGTPVMITSFNQFRRIFGTYLDTAYLDSTGLGSRLAHAVEAFYTYTSGYIWVVRTAHYDPDPTDPVDLTAVKATITLQDRDVAPVDTLKLTATSEGTWGNDLTVTIEDGYDDSANEFDLTVKLDGVVVERHPNLSMESADSNYVVDMIAANSTYLVAEDLESVTVAPDNRPAVQANTSLASGDDGLGTIAVPTIVAVDFEGSKDPVNGTGMYCLNSLDDISLIAIPGVTDMDVHEGLIDFCEQTAKFVYAILDSELDMSPTDLLAYVKTTAGFDTKEAGIFYPWAEQKDALKGLKGLFPTSGHICGLVAKTTLERGVHKAAAGIKDGRLRNVVGLEVLLDGATRDILYPGRINCIKSEPGLGEVVWGNRTLSKDLNWEQMSVRRTYHNVARSILQGTQELVFEPNNRDTQMRARDITYLLLLEYWKDGAFNDGGTGDPANAFYVTCDSSNNPESEVIKGNLVIDIGIAFTHAAEFVIFRISQWDGGRILEEVGVS